MDCNTGEIFNRGTPEDEAEFSKRYKLLEKANKKLAPLSERQHEELKLMGNKLRKGYMRNQPCVCGSGKKFKRCCWSKYT